MRIFHAIYFQSINNSPVPVHTSCTSLAPLFVCTTFHVSAPIESLLVTFLDRPRVPCPTTETPRADILHRFMTYVPSTTDWLRLASVGQHAHSSCRRGIVIHVCESYILPITIMTVLSKMNLASLDSEPWIEWVTATPWKTRMACKIKAESACATAEHSHDKEHEQSQQSVTFQMTQLVVLEGVCISQATTMPAQSYISASWLLTAFLFSFFFT